MSYLIALLILALFSFLVLDYIVTSREDRIRERLLEGMFGSDEDDVSLWADAADLLKVDAFRQLIEKSALTRNFDIKLKRSGLKITLIKGLMLNVVTVLLGAVIGYYYFKNITAVVAVILVIPGVMWFLLSNLAQRRLKKHDQQLPALITGLITTVGAGGTPMQALQVASKNAPKPISESVDMLVNGMQIGKSPIAAWKDWSEFWDTPSCKLISTGIRLKWESGGQMTAILAHILETLEFRKRMELRVSTLTAQAKLSAWVLSALPVALALLTNAYRPDLFDAMLSDPLGVKLLIAAGIMTLLGFIWLGKIARLKN
jgi:tight adherence protein B